MVGVVECLEDVVEVVEVVDGLEDSMGKFLDEKAQVHIIRVDTWKEGDVHKPVKGDQRTFLQRIKEVYDGYMFNIFHH